MFLKTNPPTTAGSPASNKNAIPTIITRELHILGNIVSEGVIDFDGTLDGNIRASSFTLRANGTVKGEVSANVAFIYGKVKGMIRAKTVHLYASCNVEGIIMHEAISIEDGAFIDGKFKRTDKPHSDDGEDTAAAFETSDAEGDPKVLENIRLIR